MPTPATRAPHGTRPRTGGGGVFLVAVLGGLACAATFSVSISQILLGLALALRQLIG